MRRTINLGIYTTEAIIVPLCRGWWRFILLWSGCTPVYLYELMTSWRYTCLPVRADDIVKVWCCEVDVHVFTCMSWWRREGTLVYLYELMTCDCSQVFTVIRGKLAVTIHRTKFIVESGDVFFVPVGQYDRHSYLSNSFSVFLSVATTSYNG